MEPKLTPFCTELTGITQDKVDAGIPFTEALAKYHSFLSSAADDIHIEGPYTNCHILTCGDWDLKQMLPKQCRVSGIPIPGFMKRWVNIKKVMPKFKAFTRTKVYGMTHMLELLGLELEGRHHSGIDDCRNIARIVVKTLETQPDARKVWKSELV